MMSNFRKILCICVMAAVLVMAFPVSSLAVDPVSAATMANAFAQAITAYGASQGVSMTFDVANTDGIGEGVHDLWEQYADDMAQSNVTVSDYSNLAASVFPTLWKKTFNYVTISLDAATVGEIDGFWNWLLSGPAEMTKVDNAYYEWSVNQNNTVDPISVYSISSLIVNGHQFYNTPVSFPSNNNGYTNNVVATSGNVYILNVYKHGNNPVSNASTIVAVTDDLSSSGYWQYINSNNVVTTTTQFTFASPRSYGDLYYINIAQAGVDPQYTIESNTTSNYWYLENVFGAASSATISSDTNGLSVRPYIGDTAPQNVYIPDNTDVNYTPVAAEIPLDILWDDSLFGDGTDTLTDTQSEAITQAADNAITDNPEKTLELADTANPPTPNPSEVYIPFLPVTLPNFQFSLSGIWHYVTAWVASLGAWFSLVFTTWSYLPYAISVPVYATAVIVIVLGVYKRFFM